MSNNPKYIDFDPDQLISLAQNLSQQFWQKKCEVPLVWNGRLSRTMGRFCYFIQKKKRIPLRIELSKKSVPLLDQQTFNAVLLHELCHYHLFIEGKPFADHHPLFEAELRRVGAISTNTIKVPQKGYDLYCGKCQTFLGKRKRFNNKNYLSACCKERIIKKESWL